MNGCHDECEKNNHPGLEHEEWSTEPIDDRISLPPKFYRLLNEAINDLYYKVGTENEKLVEWHKDGGPMAVYRPAHEAQTVRIGEAGMLMLWFRQGFRMDENE